VVTRNNGRRKLNRRSAITFIVEKLGNDVVTTHEVWHYGHALIDEKVTFPRGAKRAFQSINRIDDLGQLLRGHPEFEFVDDVEIREKQHGRSRRFRTKMWIRR
jgi:hypothetical protein